jgi:AhpD family alkylhydroperoxidase
MNMWRNNRAILVVAALALGPLVLPASAADDTYNAAIKDVETTFGFVPTFMKQQPKTGFAGAWQHLKALEFSGDTALSAKTKALIGLAVVAQIPCSYCIWADARAARAAGATDEEIAEAVAIAATERYWSTMLNGLEVDLDTFKNELGPLTAAEGQAK